MSELVLVSGSSRGLGAHIAKSFAKRLWSGYKLLSSQSKKGLKNFWNKNKSFYTDISEKNDVLTMMEKIKNHFGILQIFL